MAQQQQQTSSAAQQIQQQPLLHVAGANLDALGSNDGRMTAVDDASNLTDDGEVDEYEDADEYSSSEDGGGEAGSDHADLPLMPAPSWVPDHTFKVRRYEGMGTRQQSSMTAPVGGGSMHCKSFCCGWPIAFRQRPAAASTLGHIFSCNDRQLDTVVQA